MFQFILRVCYIVRVERDLVSRLLRKRGNRSRKYNMESDMPGPKQKPPGRGRIIAGWIFNILSISMLIGMFVGPHSREKWVDALLQDPSFPILLTTILWVILCNLFTVFALVFGSIAFLRNNNPSGRYVLICAVLLFLGITGRQFMPSDEPRKEAVEVISSIQKEFAHLNDDPADQEKWLARLKGKAGNSNRLNKDLAGFEEYMKGFVAGIGTLSIDYSRELENAGWYEILDPDRLLHDPAFAQSKATIQKAKTAVDRYEKQMDLLVQSTKAHINSLDMTDKAKKTFLSDFSQSMDKAKPQLRLQWNLQRQMVGQAEKAILLLANSNNWQIEDGDFFFGDDSEQALFNSYMQSIDQITEKLEQLRKNHLAKVDRSFETAKDTIGK